MGIQSQEIKIGATPQAIVCAYQNKGGSEHAVKIRFAGSFLLASVFTITARALIKTLRPADLSSSAASQATDTLQKV